MLAAGYNALGPQMFCVPRDIDRIFFYVVVFQPLRRINININRHFLTYLLTYLLTYYSVLPQVNPRNHVMCLFTVEDETYQCDLKLARFPGSLTVT